jgi:hypothetical protein
VHLRLDVMFISCMVEIARKVIEPLKVFVQLIEQELYAR